MNDWMFLCVEVFAFLVMMIILLWMLRPTTQPREAVQPVKRERKVRR